MHYAKFLANLCRSNHPCQRFNITENQHAWQPLFVVLCLFVFACFHMQFNTFKIYLLKFNNEYYTTVQIQIKFYTRSHERY